MRKKKEEEGRGRTKKIVKKTKKRENRRKGKRIGKQKTKIKGRQMIREGIIQTTKKMIERKRTKMKKIRKKRNNST